MILVPLIKSSGWRFFLVGLSKSLPRQDSGVCHHLDHNLMVEKLINNLLMLLNTHFANTKKICFRTAVVTHLVEKSLPPPEVRGSDPINYDIHFLSIVIGKIQKVKSKNGQNCPIFLL